MKKFDEAVAEILQAISADSCGGCGGQLPKYFDQYPNFCPSCGARRNHETFVKGQVSRVFAGYDPQTVDLSPEVKAVAGRCTCGFKMPEGEQAVFCPGCGVALRGVGTLKPQPPVEPRRVKANVCGEEDENLGL